MLQHRNVHKVGEVHAVSVSHHLTRIYVAPRSLITILTSKLQASAIVLDAATSQCTEGLRNSCRFSFCVASQSHITIFSPNVTPRSLITIFSPPSSLKTVLQGWRDNRGDHHLPSRGGEDAAARLKLRLRHTAQAAALGGEEGGGGAVQGDQVDRQGRPPVRLPASPGLAVLSECATFKSEPTLWLSDADPLLHPVAAMSTAAVEVVRVPRPNLRQGAHRSLDHSADEGPTDDGGVGLPLSYCRARRTSGSLPGSCAQPGRSCS